MEQAWPHARSPWQPRVWPDTAKAAWKFVIPQANVAFIALRRSPGHHEMWWGWEERRLAARSSSAWRELQRAPACSLGAARKAFCPAPVRCFGPCERSGNTEWGLEAPCPLPGQGTVWWERAAARPPPMEGTARSQMKGARGFWDALWKRPAGLRDSGDFPAGQHLCRRWGAWPSLADGAFPAPPRSLGSPPAHELILQLALWGVRWLSRRRFPVLQYYLWNMFRNVFKS